MSSCGASWKSEGCGSVSLRRRVRRFESYRGHFAVDTGKAQASEGDSPARVFCVSEAGSAPRHFRARFVGRSALLPRLPPLRREHLPDLPVDAASIAEGAGVMDVGGTATDPWLELPALRLESSPDGGARYPGPLRLQGDCRSLRVERYRPRGTEEESCPGDEAPEGVGVCRRRLTGCGDATTGHPTSW